MSEITTYVHYNEYDFNKNFPLLVIQLETHSVGYRLDPDTGELERCCICFARSENECTCGYPGNEE